MYQTHRARARGPVILPDHIVPAWTHPQAQAYLRGRGLNHEEVQRYDLSFCSKGYMANRIIIPMYSEAGILVAYQGRSIDPHAHDEVRYLTEGPRPLYCPWDVGDVVIGSPLVVVEGPFDVYAVSKVVKSVGATLSIQPSERQIQEIVQAAGLIHSSQILVWYDAGARSEAYALKLKLNPYVLSYVVESNKKDPGECLSEEIDVVLNAARGDHGHT